MSLDEMLQKLNELASKSENTEDEMRIIYALEESISALTSGDF